MVEMLKNTCIHQVKGTSDHLLHRNIRKHNIKRSLMLFSDFVPYVEQEVLTLPEHLSSPTVFVGFVLLFSFCVVLCRSLFVLLSFVFRPLYCLSFNLRFLIRLLVSSNFSCVFFAHSQRLFIQPKILLFRIQMFPDL